MKRFYLILILLLSLAFIGFAQGSKSTLLSEGFESSTFPPEEWTTKNIDGYNQWSSYSGGANSSSYAASVGYGSITQENWLITPQLMPSSTDNQLTFWAKTSGAYSTIYFNVKVSTTDNNLESFSSTSLFAMENSSDATEISSTWTQYTVDLSSFIDQPLFIGFQIVGGGDRIHLDDITGIPYAEFANDLKVKSLIIPSTTDFKFDGDNVALSAIIKNIGTTDQTNAAINFKVDGISVKSELLSIAAGVTDTVSITWTATVGLHSVAVEVPSDDNSFANSQNSSLIVYPVGSLVESFEGTTFPPTNWTNESSKWLGATFNYYNGTKCAGVYSSNYKLITPKLIIADGDSLSFYGYAYTGNTFSVLSSEDLIKWDTLGNYAGTSSNVNYKIYFNGTNNASSIGNRYIAFVAGGQYGSLYVDMVSGPQIYPVTDDFELLSFAKKTNADFARAGSPVDFTVVVRNNAAVSQSKTVYLKNGSTVLVSTDSKTLSQGETDTLTISWVPDQGYPAITLTAELPSDDVLGNNKATIGTYVYPKDPVSANISLDFESATSLPDYWISDNISSATWKVVSGQVYSPSCTAHKGVSMLDFQCYANTGNVKLTSPWLNLPYNTYKISFWLYRDATTWTATKADLVNVRVNSTPDTSGSVLVGTINRSTSLEPTVAAAGWYYYEFHADCSNITTGFVIFEGASVGSYCNIYIDDLSIEGIPPYDASLTAINAPTNTIWGYPAASKDVKVVLKNTGENSLTSATIHWSVNGDAQTDYAWNGSLDYTESDTVSIATDHSFDAGAVYSIEATVDAVNDTITSNNSVQGSVNVKLSLPLPYANGFEDATNPTEDWLVKDMDGDGFSWEVSSASPKFGSQHIRSASYNETTSEELTPDNWLISPGLHIAHNKAFLSYYVGAGDNDYFAEKYQVLISETGTDTADFSTVLRTETLTGKAYKQVVLDLNEYQGKTIFIAFRHFDCTNNLYLNIDSVALYYPAVYNVTLTANPAEAGTVSDNVEFIDGESVTVKATANAGYEFVNWTEGSVEISTNLDYTYTPTAENHSLVANFNLLTYTISATAGDNGSITPSGDVVVNYGTDQEFAFTPTTGYKVSSVQVDGSSVGAVNTYKFTGVVANHSISVSFEELTYTVTFTVLHGTDPVSGANISIDGVSGALTSNASGVATVALKNGTYAYTITANGYDTYTGNLTVTDSNLDIAVNITATGIGNNTLSSVSVYPNPFNTFVKVDNTSNVAVVIVSDIIGNEVKRLHVGNSESLTINLNLPSGTYLFTFIDNNGKRITKKLIKR